MAQLPRPPLKKWFLKQLMAVVAICGLASIIWPSSLLEIMAGAIIAYIPQQVFSYLVFMYRGARQQANLVKMFFVAEGVKFGLTVVLFVLVFILVQPSNPISLLSTYAAVILLNWLNFLLVK
ncbi:MAG: hypothetical protein GX029_08695 [Pseudomonadaceae bacterium]|nr:hypothetical protein [Pseudomonadaceae bacterium]